MGGGVRAASRCTMTIFTASASHRFQNDVLLALQIHFFLNLFMFIYIQFDAFCGPVDRMIAADS